MTALEPSPLSLAHSTGIEPDETRIGRALSPNCCLCGSPGVSLYSAQPDRLFSAPGRWELKQFALIRSCA